MKRANHLVLKLSVAALSLLALAGCGSGEDSPLSSTAGVLSNQFSYWLPYSTPSTYYSDYNDNPMMRYLTKYHKWGANKDELSFTFDIPSSDAVDSSFSTMLAADDLDDLFMPVTEKTTNLYEDGYVMELTDLVKQYMPNYMNWINNHASARNSAYVKVNGEKKIIEVGSYGAKGEPWCGYQYRRDWLVKYGTNPKTGKAFTGGWNADKTAWEDDVIFPNETSAPIYISDWEWMFNIFAKALKAENISGGYCTSLYYMGFIPMGDLVSAFGGGGPTWYINDKTVEFGANSDNFRTYLTAMNSWYKKGWVDTHFTERTSDMFYLTDTNAVVNGKVGLFLGPTSYLGNGLKETMPDACLYPAAEPINDTYGTAEMKGVEPYCFYQLGDVGTPMAINSKAKDKKNIPALLEMLDYLYSDDGSFVNSVGFSKEIYDECQDPLYKKYGFTEGTYTWVDANGDPWTETSTGEKKFKTDERLTANSDLNAALVSCRLPGRGYGNDKKYRTESKIYLDGINTWSKYTASGDLLTNSAVKAGMSTEDGLSVTKINNSISEFMSKNVPTFITGARNILDDSTWNSFKSGLGKYKPETVTAIYQSIIDSFD
ncbi:MAG: hypothetical protein LKJ88_07355 [Bacilli bacterium]|jgi:putative aldouronate transport system substrate-binding protein|nr:hypothetical protein [Bacilli bacterium]